MSGQDISSGSVIVLTDGRQGTVRFIGSTHFAVGEWIGVELMDATGKNDGAVQGERYFDCEPGFGMFIRPTAVGEVLQQAPRESKQATKPANATTSRQSSSDASTGARKPGSEPLAASKRTSLNAATAATASKGAARASLRSPSKSPTKQLSTPNRSSFGGAARASTLPSTRPRPTPAVRSSTGPGATAATTTTTRTSRPSVVGTVARGSRPVSQSTATSTSTAAGVAKRASLRKTATKGSDSSESGTGGPSEESINAEGGDSPLSAENAPVVAPVPSARPPRQSLTAARPTASRPGAAVTTQRSSTSVSRELDELQTKLRIMEKKRAEDRERLKTLEQLQSERDKFESIIQKLQAKYQPQQMEVTELRKKLKETEARLEGVERMQAEHESLMEMASLDRDMADETADAFRHECEVLRSKMEELQLEAEVLREENEAFGEVTSPEERSSHGWLQMEKTNERLREALIRLRDMTQQQETDLKDQIKELEQDLEEYSAVKSDYEATKEKLLVAENNVDDLKQQLETALGAEEMIEELADKNLHYQEEINELKAAIEDLEALKEISEELEFTHIETEKQFQDEIDYRDGVFNEQSRKLAVQDEVIEDLEYTLSRFRELVTNLQADLEDMRASQQISEAEATDLTSRSRAMIDLNLKLQASVSKAQTRTIDLGINKMEAEEAAQHLSIVKLYLPEYFDEERNSVLALLRFKRVGSKAIMMNSTIREMMSEQSAISAHEEMFNAHEVLELLLWISNVCDRFVRYVSACTPEEFNKTKAALFEMEPVERMLNFWIENLKKNEVNMKKFAVELQRSIALLEHLAETTLPSTPEMFADELCMRTALSQSYIEHAAGTVARLKSILISKLQSQEEENEEQSFALSQIDSFVNEARGYKVALGKIHRAVEDLRSRSLALSKDAADEPFKSAERSARKLSGLSRKLGESVLDLISDEGRAEPFTLKEMIDVMSQVSTAFEQSSDVPMETSDPLTLLNNTLRDFSTRLEGLDSISTDLSHTAEFERGAFPWIARAQELKSNKTISPDADEEIQRLKNEVHEVSTALGAKDNTLEEQGIKIELLESRMRDANKRALAVKELEGKVEEAQSSNAKLTETVERQQVELQAAEVERDEFKTRLERMKRASGTVGVTTTGGGIVIDNEASLAALQENESLRTEVESLQSAVRFLREESRRAKLLDPYSVQRTTDMRVWLDGPLTPGAPTAEQEKVQRTALESRDVLTHLLKLTKETRVCDLKSTMIPSVDESGDSSSNRTAWRPSKSRLRYQVLQHRENFEHWAEWRDDIVNYEREQDRLAAAKQDRALRQRTSKHSHNASVEFPQGLGHGMMGRTWQIMGMQKHRKTASGNEPDSVEIVSVD
ncbi:hypothetical protein N7495_004006 [Penicillium taxi]|uniref:uncharacterized protein n=1 Tax=Penicillium taxi TaxID=168475 RepID=UPI002544E97D|nr:uncharacterized protein N7495_004006 [Penicillium taxi]KAJ5899262.1 hypothetical protein N7495_004006 [Penicillium taxi]